MYGIWISPSMVRIVSQSRDQCCGAGSVGPACFWPSRIRIRHYLYGPSKSAKLKTYFLSTLWKPATERAGCGSATHWSGYVPICHGTAAALLVGLVHLADMHSRSQRSHFPNYHSVTVENLGPTSALHRHISHWFVHQKIRFWKYIFF